MREDFAILAAVDAAPSHAFQVLDHLNMLGIRATRGELHQRVDALTAAGMLETVVGSPTEQGRRLIRLTPKGHQALAEETLATLRREPLESPLFALAVTSARAGNAAVFVNVLRSRITTATRRLTAEERALAQQGGDERFWSRAGREQRIATLQADINWLQSVITPEAAIPQLPQAG